MTAKHAKRRKTPKPTPVPLCTCSQYGTPHHPGWHTSDPSSVLR